MTTAAGQPADEPASWPVLRSERVYEGSWVVSLREDVLTRPGDDREFTRVVVEDPGAVVVLAVDDEDRVVVVRQYRHAVQHVLLQLPAGVLDEPGEDPLVAAQRELAEETGLAARRWDPLITTFASPGKSSETHTFYLARDLRDVDHDFEAEHEEAEMTVERVPYDDLLDAVVEHRAQDAPLITALLAYDLLRRRGRV